MFRRCIRRCRNTVLIRLLLQGICILLGIIALSVLFTFLASHLGILIGIAVLVAVIVMIQLVIASCF